MSSPDAETGVNTTATEDAQPMEHEQESQNDSQQVKETTLPPPVEEELKMETEIDETSEKAPLTDDDISSALKHARAEFNKNRKILITDIPPVTYSEVKEYLGGRSIKNISISKKTRTAIVTLVHGEEAEEIVTDRVDCKLLDTVVEVSIHPTENLLCIAHLPFDMGDKKFIDLVAQYGAIERAFLMRSSGGASKGYGFVEFAHNPEKSNDVRRQLDGKKIDSFVLECDFVLPHIISFDQLHSSCLLVDQLPTDYKNVMDLRGIFSRLVVPPYCQLGMQNGKALGFGIVEYATADQAETAQFAVNGHTLQGTNIRVSFCIPGEKAIDIYNKMMTTVSGGSLKTGLLPNPMQPPLIRNVPAPMGGNSNTPTQSSGNAQGNLTNPMMQNLLAQNPQVLASFQNVLGQLQQRVQLQQQMQRPGLLGIAPNNQPPSPLHNPNLQIAILAVFMATQLQQLSHCQALIRTLDMERLVNLVNRRHPLPLGATMTQPGMFLNPLLQQAIAANLQQQNSLVLGGGYMGLQSKKPSLLGNPMIAQANSMLQGLMKPEQSSQSDQERPGQEQATGAAGSGGQADPSGPPPVASAPETAQAVDAQGQSVKEEKTQGGGVDSVVKSEEAPKSSEAGKETTEGEGEKKTGVDLTDNKPAVDEKPQGQDGIKPQGPDGIKPQGPDGIKPQGPDSKPSEPLPDLHVLNNFQKMLATIQGNCGDGGDNSAPNSRPGPLVTRPPMTSPPSLLSTPATQPSLLGRHPTGITPQQLVSVMSAGTSLQQQQLLNAGAANPILAMFIEAQIRQQLLNLEKVSKARLFMSRLQQQQPPQQQQQPQPQQQQPQPQHPGVYQFSGGSGGGSGFGGRKQGLLGNQPPMSQNAPSGGLWYTPGSQPQQSSGLLKTPSMKSEDSASSYQHGTDSSKYSQYNSSSYGNYYNSGSSCGPTGSGGQGQGGSTGSTGPGSNQRQNYEDWKPPQHQYSGAQQAAQNFQQQYPTYPPYGTPEYRKMYEQYQEYYKLYYQEQNSSYAANGSGTNANTSASSYSPQNSSGYGSQNNSSYSSQNTSNYGSQNNSGYGSQGNYYGGYDSQMGNYDSYSTYGNSGSAQSGYGTHDNYGSSQDGYNFSASYNQSQQGGYGNTGYDFSNSYGGGKSTQPGGYGGPTDAAPYSATQSQSSYTSTQPQNTYNSNYYSQTSNTGSTTTTTDVTTSQAVYMQQQQQYQEMYRQYMLHYSSTAQAPTTNSLSVSPGSILSSQPPPPPPGPPPADNEPSGDVKATPTGQKRSYPAHLLPSPEPSPEGQYVGQHSQGLGGHYADTLLIKRRRI